METQTLDSGLIEKLKGGSIYKFSYSYRGGLEADIAFLLCNDAGDIFMAVGSATAIELLDCSKSLPRWRKILKKRKRKVMTWTSV